MRRVRRTESRQSRRRGLDRELDSEEDWKRGVRLLVGDGQRLVKRTGIKPLAVPPVTIKNSQRRPSVPKGGEERDTLIKHEEIVKTHKSIAATGGIILDGNLKKKNHKPRTARGEVGMQSQSHGLRRKV